MFAHMDVDLSEFVSKIYEMDPEIEDLLPNGSYLRDGMTVLIESVNVRQSLAKNMLEADLALAKRYNRWCTISHVEQIGNRISFVGTYENGSKLKYVEAMEAAWLVKRDSVPEHHLYKMIFATVRDIMRVARSDKVDKENMTDYATTFTRQIIDLIDE